MIQTLFSLATIFYLHTVVINAQSLRVSRADLSSCLTGLNVTFPSNSAFTAESQAFNERLHYTPAAIAFPNSVQDVSTIVTCGASQGVPVVARSGGHSYAAYSLGGVNGALVVDLSALTNITLGNGTAVVQTGNRLGAVAEYLWNNGQLALPHGTCPTVGTGGHTSYGGYGPFSRMGGLLVDRVVSADVVLANGTSITASNTSYPDLFWALKGAAPSYGIVTSWTYSTLSAPPVSTYFSISLPTYTTGAAFASAFSQYQTFAQSASNEMAMAFSLGPSGSGGIFVQLIGNYFGSQADFTNLVNDLVQSLGASIDSTTAQYTDWTQLLVANNNGVALVGTGPEAPDTFFAKSLTINELLPNASLLSWGNYLMQTAAQADIGWFAQADLYGGAISSFDINSASYAHRAAFLVFQFYGTSGNPPFPSDGIDVINNMLSSITTNPEGAYPNYIDPTLSAQQWQSLYFGDNMPRLSGVKAVYDPNNVFSFPQSIPLGDPSAATVVSLPSGTTVHLSSPTGAGSPSANHLSASGLLTMAGLILGAYSF